MLGQVICFCVAATIFWYTYWYYRRRSLSGINAPIHFPFIGSAFMCSKPNNLEAIRACYKKCTESFVVVILHLRIVGLSGSTLIEFISTSTKTLKKSIIYDIYKNWLGAGILLSHGDKWQKRRKIIAPTFHFKLLEDYMQTFNSNIDILIKQLNKETDEMSTNICPYITLYTLDVICECAMGTTINAQTNKESAYAKNVQEICRIYIKRALSLEGILAVCHLIGESKKERACLEVLHGFTMSVIKNRRELLLQNKCDETDELKKKVFIDLLLESTMDGIPLSDEDIREEVDTFIFAGHDTVSTAISFILFSLADNPQVQRKVLEEQINIYGTNITQDCTTSDLHSMKYLEMVIKETMRLYPPVPFIGREAIGDAKYSDDVIFKKDDQISIFIYGLHRDPKFYPDPDAFIPERFAPEGNSEGKRSQPYMPFSIGPRNCIGQKFAMLEIKTTISKIIRMYELCPIVPAHKPVLISETILKSDNGLLVRLKNRYL